MVFVGVFLYIIFPVCFLPCLLSACLLMGLIFISSFVLGLFVCVWVSVYDVCLFVWLHCFFTSLFVFFLLTCLAVRVSVSLWVCVLLFIWSLSVVLFAYLSVYSCLLVCGSCCCCLLCLSVNLSICIYFSSVGVYLRLRSICNERKCYILSFGLFSLLNTFFNNYFLFNTIIIHH